LNKSYQERFESLNKFIDNYEKEKYLKSFKPYNQSLPNIHAKLKEGVRSVHPES